MDYFRPVYEINKEKFVIRPFHYPDDRRDELVFLFDFPQESRPLLGTSPHELSFDYFNPLVLLPGTNNSEQVEFGQKKFTCSELLVPEDILVKFRKEFEKQKIFSYSPNWAIQYPQMKILPTFDQAPQICNLLSQALFTLLAERMAEISVSQILANIPFFVPRLGRDF